MKRKMREKRKKWGNSGNLGAKRVKVETDGGRGRNDGSPELWHGWDFRTFLGISFPFPRNSIQFLIIAPPPEDDGQSKIGTEGTNWISRDDNDGQNNEDDDNITHNMEGEGEGRAIIAFGRKGRG